jgi:putative membrane protein
MPKYHQRLLIVFILFAAATCIHPPYPEQLPLQHIPTVLMLIALIASKKLRSLSKASFTLIIAYLVLHSIGARYIYSYVPYDSWTKSLFGFNLNNLFGLTRNGYDRLVHFSFGLLFLYPVRELLLRYTKASETLANYISLEFIMASSMLYELFEWLIAIVLSPENAEAYNGQQGDMWDSQKDMTCATIGALVTLTIILIRRWRLAK